MKPYRVAVFIVIIIVLAVAGWAIGRYHGKTQVATTAPAGTYVALGDSVAAGLGLKTYADASACDRTTEAYPNVVASKLGYSLTSYACSGASTSAGLIGSQTVNELSLASQQSQLFALAQPKLVSATIGVNDTGWTAVLTKCYTGTCGTPADTDAISAALTSMSINLNAFLSAVKVHYGATPPLVVLTGYHQIFPAVVPADCTTLATLDPAEVTWARQQQSRLNTAIQTVASGYSFAKFAPVDFTGHELCTSDPWVQDLQSAAPFHPNEQGQPAFAAAVEAAAQASGK
ncbi:SGNH/GDSL hydrolase family protein [Candidatus Saccharibacteria bacterium]|nr:SGNH/GDSL hydrolase family protein [Candidatus Saccharibacteria bacterium]